MGTRNRSQSAGKRSALGKAKRSQERPGVKGQRSVRERIERERIEVARPRTRQKVEWSDRAARVQLPERVPARGEAFVTLGEAFAAGSWWGMTVGGLSGAQAKDVLAFGLSGAGGANPIWTGGGYPERRFVWFFQCDRELHAVLPVHVSEREAETNLPLCPWHGVAMNTVHVFTRADWLVALKGMRADITPLTGSAGTRFDKQLDSYIQDERDGEIWSWLFKHREALWRTLGLLLRAKASPAELAAQGSLPLGLYQCRAKKPHVMTLPDVKQWDQSGQPLCPQHAEMALSAWSPQ